MTLHLKEIEQSDGDDVYEMFQELPKFELGSENIANGMTKIQFEDYKKKLVDNSKGLNLKTVINNQKIEYVLYRDGYPIGRIALRLKLNKYGREHYGHIGYSIRSSERGKGYGNVMLGLALAKARNKGMKEVLLQCNKDNLASQKVIENNGGIKFKENESYYYRIILTEIAA
jgi:predicted acetyltransferase